jgi:beta-catenin-like protein 1
LLLSFEKKINKNQAMRMKHPDQPETFLDSEIELHKEINNLYAVSASPELYPVVVESGSVPSILGMIAHDNTDISIAAIGLLLELTDPDTVLESDDAEVLIDSLLENQVQLPLCASHTSSVRPSN